MIERASMPAAISSFKIVFNEPQIVDKFQSFKLSISQNFTHKPIIAMHTPNIYHHLLKLTHERKREVESAREHESFAHS